MRDGGGHLRPWTLIYEGPTDDWELMWNRLVNGMPVHLPEGLTGRPGSGNHFGQSKRFTGCGAAPWGIQGKRGQSHLQRSAFGWSLENILAPAHHNAIALKSLSESGS